MSDISLIHGDCLEKLKDIPDKSINLVLIDPPYNIGKDTWDKWDSVNDYVEFMGKVFKEIERVLKDNGSFYFFHNDFLQIVELQNWINKNTKFEFKQLITWSKMSENFKNYGFVQQRLSINMMRNYYNGFTEYILYYTFKDGTELRQIYDDEKCFIEIKEYLRNERNKVKKAGYTDKDLRNLCGVSLNGGGLLCHYWGKKQWMLPTEKHYKSLQKTGYFQKPYEEIKDEYERLRQEYENERYTFNNCNVKENFRGNSNVWLYPPEENRKHITQKPLDILEHIILISSNENDIILDCFMGSGSTGVACINTNRKFIGIEIDEKYFEIAKNRIELE